MALFRCGSTGYNLNFSNVYKDASFQVAEYASANRTLSLPKGKYFCIAMGYGSSYQGSTGQPITVTNGTQITKGAGYYEVTLTSSGTITTTRSSTVFCGVELIVFPIL